MVSPLAYIHPEAKIGENVEIAPFVFIDKNVVIGDNNKIMANVNILYGSRIGNGNTIFPGAVIGAVPQDLKFRGEESTAEIGDNNLIRENVTVNRGTAAKGRTIVGSNNLLMEGVHVAHDALIGNGCIIGNSTKMAGEIVIDDNAIISANVLMHQFCHVGSHVMIQGGCRFSKDIPPYIIAGREPIAFSGINIIGLRRRGFANEVIESIHNAYRIIYQSGLNTTDALKKIEDEVEKSPEIDYIIIGVDREGECAVAARSLALEQQRWHALNVQHISEGDVISASVLACGPTRITVTACGFDVTMGQQAMSYTYLSDMREEYHAGQQLQAKVLSVSEDMLALSVRDVGTDPYVHAELRHPVGSSRIAIISSKYAGGVFCRLTDGCTVVCRYAQQFSDDQFRVGDKVMQVRNNYEIIWNRIGGEQGVGAYNGDIGIVESINTRDRSMVVRMDDKRLVYPAENLGELEIAYAITVHKSQGSEFPAVILPVAQVPPRLCYRNLFYTGVTRARKLCIVAGRRDVVNRMMGNIRQNLRYSGLAYLLQAELPPEQTETE